MYKKRGDKYWIFYGREKNLIKNGAWVLEQSISLFHGKINPIRYFSIDELNHMNVEYDCDLHGRYNMYPGSWEGRAVLVKLLDLPEKVLLELFHEAVSSVMGMDGNDHKLEWRKIDFSLGGTHGNVHLLNLACTLPERTPEKEESSDVLELLREIVVGSQMGTHSNVHKLLGCCLETEIPVLVYEWIEDETLEDRILLINKNQKKQPLEWKDRLRIAWEISHAIAYLHTAFPRPIIHTHLTPKTVFLDNNIAKLYDFGSSVSIPDGEEFVELDILHGTSGYMAPEYLKDHHVTESIDVYSFGMLFLMLLTAKEVSEQTHISTGLKEWVQEGIKHKCISDIVDSAITRNGETAIEELQLKASIHLALSCVVKEAYCRPTMVEVATELKNMITSPESIPSTNTFKGRNIHRIFNRSEENLMQFKLLLPQCFSFRMNPIRFFSVHELNTMNVEHDQIFQYCHQGSWEGRSILVKLQNAVTIDSTEIQLSMLREILLATMTSTHNNVQKLLGCCLETKFPVLVYESVAAETLEDRISPKDENQKRLPPLAWKDRLRIAWEISHTVSYFHTAFPGPIIHGNLTPENIFLDQDGSVKLSNFNHYISFLEGEELGVKDRRIETISGLRIPEYYEGWSVAECADVYSVGLLFLVLLTGKINASFPSTTTSEHGSNNLIHWVIKSVKMERISEIIDPAINKNEVTAIELWASIDLALRCTTSLADCRPTMADVATELKRLISSHESIPCSISFQGKDMYRSFRGSKEYFMQNEAFVLEENISLFHDRARPISYFSVDQLNNMNAEYYEVFWDGFFKWYQGSWEGRAVWIKLPRSLFDMESLALSDYIRQSLLHEVVIATQMATHNNVHKLLGCCLETKFPVLVYECVSADKTLEDQILLKDENQNKLQVLEWKDRLRIALELSQVASHLHKSFPRPIIHGYLRPRSVFLDQDNTVKLSNFISSVSIPEGKNFVQNSLFDNSFYMEPEYYEQREVGECTDVYSFGILFLVLLTGKSADFSSAEGHIRSKKFIDWVTENFKKVGVSKIVDPAITETGVSTAEMTASIKLALKCTANRDKRPTMLDVATQLEKIIRSSDISNGFSRLRLCFTP